MNERAFLKECLEAAVTAWHLAIGDTRTERFAQLCKIIEQKLEALEE